MTLSFVDETTAGTKAPVFELTLQTELLTVRQVIEIRVHEDILRKKFDSQMLVKPAWLSPNANPTKTPNEKQQVEIACRAFEENRLLILLKDRQAISLDEVLALSDGDEVSFLRLIPLVGG